MSTSAPSEPQFFTDGTHAYMEIGGQVWQLGTPAFRERFAMVLRGHGENPPESATNWEGLENTFRAAAVNDERSTPQNVNGAKASASGSSITTDAFDVATGHAAETIWDGTHAYLVMQENGHVRTFPLRSNAYKRALIAKLKQTGHRTPSSATQWDVIFTEIESHVEQSGTKPTPSIRVAGSVESGTIYIDLGPDGWNCVKVTAEGWSVEPHPAAGPYFYRPPRLAALPTPEPHGELERLWYYLNASEDADRRLLLAYQLQLFLPQGPYPVLVVDGDHGSAKSTRTEVIKALADPTISSDDTPAVTKGRPAPRDEDALFATAYNNRLVSFDNVSFLSPHVADAICRLATGAEQGGKRSLYSNFDEAVFSAVRPVMMNGIPDVIGQPDLADRCIRVTATKPASPESEITFWSAFRKDWPMLLGMLLDLLVAVLRNWEIAAQRVTTDVRMKSYARVGEAIGIGLGWAPGSFTKIYAERRSEADVEIATSSILYQPLQTHLSGALASWTGTWSTLLDALNQQALPDSVRRSKTWPATPKALSNALRRIEPPLRALGITITREQTKLHGYPQITITRKTPG